MAVTLTVYTGGDAANDGETHIAALTAGSGTVQSFDAIEFGQGNNTPGATDTRATMTAKIVGLTRQAAVPVLGDSDTRNDGRATDRWTWLFVVPEGQQLLASNFIVTNYAGGAPTSAEPILCHGAQVIAKRADQVAYIWVNISTAGAASVVVHVEDGTPLVQQLASWRSESIMLSGAPGSRASDNGKVSSRMTEGSEVFTAAYVLNQEGGALTDRDVQFIALKVWKRVGEREWTLASEGVLDVLAVIAPAPVRTDPRCKLTSGYNFSHVWSPPGGWGSRKTRIEYHLRLASGASRVLIHEVDWQSTRIL